ncbi:MAG: FAD-dependent oxidoreductase, partial [Clostridiales bacterium]|nr:FAD-dependent oxidoreductase [Clostridiales bacterium]
MVVRISEVKLRIEHSEKDLEKELCRILRIHRIVSANIASEACNENVPSYEIIRRSLDARKKPDLFFVYTVDVRLENPQIFVKKLRNRHVTLMEPKKYRFPVSRVNSTSRPVITGSGPAGLFCALMLARAGLCPIVLERGEEVEKRTKTVRECWEKGVLESWANGQFGAGG